MLSDACIGGDTVQRRTAGRSRRSAPMTGTSPGEPIFSLEPVLAEEVGSPPLLAGPARQEGQPTLRPSLRRNSVARLAADVSALGLSLISATVTARLLGLSGKGYYSSVLLLGGIFIVCFSAGLGEAAIIVVGRGRVTIEAATSATTLAIAGLSVAGAVGFVAVGYLALGPHNLNEKVALLMGGLLVAININYNTLAAFLLFRERVVAVAGLAITAAALSTVALVVLVYGAHLGTAGALLGTVMGAGVVLMATVVLVRRSGIVLRPRWAPGYLRSVLPYGASLQVSNLLVLMTARVDLILVYRLRSAATAGGYSVALTIGTIVAAVPTAVSYASFPRLATLDDHDARILTAQLFRVGVVATLVAGAVVAALAPIAVPLIFGQAYRAAVAPTLLLVPGGVLWSGQWILCRAAAARGTTRPLLVSFVASCAAMVSLDFVMIGRCGGVGAAVASLIASGVGMVVSFLYYRRWGWPWRSMIPRPADVAALAQTVRHIAQPIGRRATGDEGQMRAGPRSPGGPR